MAGDLDRLSALLEQFPIKAELFRRGPLCGDSVFEAEPGRAFLHILQRGSLVVSHDIVGARAPMRVCFEEPTLVFYARAVTHAFHSPSEDGADITCATVAFSGGDTHPIARALPAVVLVPLREATCLKPTLTLLLDETRHLRCGSRLLIDRLFEVVVLQLLRWILDQGIVSVGLVAGLGDPKLARALTAVHEAPSADWSLAALAKVAGMSRSAFSAHFRMVLGITPAEYVAEWRLTRASFLLRQGKRLAHVADEVGYGSHASLSRAFRQRRGVPPTEWLRLKQQQQ